MASTRSPVLWSGSVRLAHGWILVRGPSLSKALVREFIRPAVRAIPCSMARRLGPCRISLPAEVASGVASRWTMTDGGLEVTVSTAGLEEHDVAMELLLCLGQGLWERLSDGELRAYWMLLNDEIIAGIEGEIDEQALEEKRSLFESRAHANNAKRLTGYCRASFAGTVAEYVHSLWHEVTVRTGPDYLPVEPLRRRLELMERWFPPNRGYRLFHAALHRAGPRGGLPRSQRGDPASSAAGTEGHASVTMILSWLYAGGSLCSGPTGGIGVDHGRDQDMRITTLRRLLVDVETSRRTGTVLARLPHDFADCQVRRAEVDANHTHRTGSRTTNFNNVERAAHLFVSRITPHAILAVVIYQEVNFFRTKSVMPRENAVNLVNKRL